MPLTDDERRFIRNWEEQRKGGKMVFIPIYTFGFFIIIFMSGVALGLFTGVRFIKISWLSLLGAGALVGGFLLSFVLWNRSQRKFQRIITREINEHQAS